MGSLAEQLQQIQKDVNRLMRQEMPIVGSGGTVPPAGTLYNHLEDDGAAWASVTNLTLATGAYIGLPGPGGRLSFDAAPAPDQLKVTDADLNFVTAAHGIIHVDGVAAGPPRQLLLANGTRYVPGTLAADDLPVHTHTGAGEGGTVAHSVTTGQTTDDHHAEVHVVNSTGPHAEAGLTIGHVLRVTGAAAFSFGALVAADLPAHDILSLQHGDTLAAAVSRGSLIYGNATPAWAELVHPGGAGYALTVDATDVAWSQTPTWTGDGWTWTSATTLKPSLSITNTNNDSQGPSLAFYKDSATTADGDDAGRIAWYANSSADVKSRMAHILAETLDRTDGDQAGGMRLGLLINNNDHEFLTIRGYNGVVGQGETIFNDDRQDVDHVIKVANTATALSIDGVSGHAGILTTPTATHALRVVSAGLTAAISGDETTGIGVEGTSDDGAGVRGVGDIGGSFLSLSDAAVRATGELIGVDGITSTGTGVKGRSATGIALRANLTGAGTEILLCEDNGLDVFVVDDGGNVGIGVNPPGGKLDVAGGIRITADDVFAANVAQLYTSPVTGAVWTGHAGSGYDFAILEAGGTQLIANQVATNNLSLVQTGGGGVAVGLIVPAAKLHVDQSSTTAAIPVLSLDQADISEEMINFIVAATGAGNPVDTATAVGTPYARLRVAVNGTFKYIQLYNA